MGCSFGKPVRFDSVQEPACKGQLHHQQHTQLYSNISGNASPHDHLRSYSNGPGCASLVSPSVQQHKPKIARFAPGTPDGSGLAQPTRFDGIQFEKARREFLVVARVEAWAHGKDLAALLGSLDHFAPDFPSYSVPIGPKLVVRLRMKPNLLRKAYRSACHVLHPDKLQPSKHALALFLLRLLKQSYDIWEEEEAPFIDEVDGDSDQSNCTIS